VLHQFGPRERQSECSSIDGGVDLIQHIGQRANVIFVAVSQKNGPDSVLNLPQVSDVGNNDVNARQFGIREHHAAIDHHGVIAILEDHHVHAELAEASERDGS
jgi:hypothetical protein